MTTLERIKAEIPKLTLEERADLARSLHLWEDDEWDQQIRDDLRTGKLNSILAEVDCDLKDGKLTDLP